MAKKPRIQSSESVEKRVIFGKWGKMDKGTVPCVTGLPGLVTAKTPQPEGHVDIFKILKQKIGIGLRPVPPRRPWSRI